MNLEKQSIIGVNYWIEKSSQDKRPNLNGFELVVHNSMDLHEFIIYINKIAAMRKIIYFSANKTVQSAQECLLLAQFPFLFVDAVTKELFPDREEKPDYMYVKQARSLSDIYQYLVEAASQYKADIIVIDALSQFISFNSELEDSEYLRSFLSDLRYLMKTELLLSKIIFLYDNSSGNPLVYPRISFDNITKLELLS